MNVDCIFAYDSLFDKIDKKLPNSSCYFDVTQFISKHRANRTFSNVDLLLNNKGLFIKSIYDVIPSLSSNIWFKTKYKKELKDLRITSNLKTYKNTFYHDLLQNYVKLSSRIEAQINSFSSQYFASYFIIGLQIRTGKMPDRTELNISFYNDNHTKLITESLRIYNELLSLNITSKMYMLLL